LFYKKSLQNTSIFEYIGCLFTVPMLFNILIVEFWHYVIQSTTRRFCRL